MRFFFILFLWGFSITGFGQAQEIDLSTFLRSARSATGYQLRDEYIGHLRSSSFRLPLIEKLEFRTETNSFDLSRQEYVLRLNPNSLGERKWRAALLQSELELEETELQLDLLQNLDERYQLALEWYFIQQQLKLTRALLPVLKDVVVKETYQLAGGASDLRDVVEAEQDLEEEQLKLYELEARQITIRQRIGLLLAGSSREFRPWSLIRIDQMEVQLESLFAQLGMHPAIIRQQIRTRQVGEEMKMESSELWQPLSFVQARYRGQDREFFQEAFSLSLGIRVPLKGSTQYELNMLELEKAQEEYQLEEAQWSLEQTLQAGLLEWSYLLDRYRYLEAKTASDSVRFAPERFQELAANDPGAILYLKKRELEQKIVLQRLEHQLYSRYLYLLRVSGKQIAQPLTNYLSAGLEPF